MRGTLRDITSIPRLGLVYDMQNQMATGYARWKMDQSEGALLFYPAWEFTRVEDRRVPREEKDPGFWDRRWVAAAQAVRVFRDTGRKVALKTSGIWSKLSKMVAHANDVAEVLYNLKQRFPGIPMDGVKKLLLVNPRGNALGLATLRDSPLMPARMAIRSKAYHESRAEAWEKSAAARNTAGKIKFSVDHTFDGTIRHEMGHVLTTKAHVEALNNTPYGPSWARNHLSEYAGTNSKETLAEAFCEYTKPDYKKGSLPELLEKILDDMLHP